MALGVVGEGKEDVGIKGWSLRDGILEGEGWPGPRSWVDWLGAVGHWEICAAPWEEVESDA